MGVIFGPVPSRRLGYSLGIDLLPAGHKACSYNCIYCQVGATQSQSLERSETVPSVEIFKAIDQTLPMPSINYVTFSGSGEPTLHKDLGKFIDRVRTRCGTPVAVITNGSLLDRPDVRRDLAKANLVIPTLNAVSKEIYEKICRPHPALRLENTIDGLIKFAGEFKGKLWIEIMVVKGVNDGLAEILKIKTVLDRIINNIDKIHINTVIRPPSEEYAKPLGNAELDRIVAMLGPKAMAVGASPTDSRVLEEQDLNIEIYELIKRRSVTVPDLMNSLGLPRNLAVDILEKLVQEKKIKKVVHGGVTYYREYY